MKLITRKEFYALFTYDESDGPFLSAEETMRLYLKHHWKNKNDMPEELKEPIKEVDESTSDRDRNDRN